METAFSGDSFLNKSSRDTLFFLAVQLFKNNMFQESSVLYQYLLRHDPANASLYGELGKSYQALGVYEKAIFCYDNALTLGCDDNRFNYYKAQCHVLSRKFELALLEIVHFLSRPPQNPYHSQLHDLALQLKKVIEKNLNDVSVS